MREISLQETNTFLPYRLGDTARDTLQEFIDIDVTADDLVRILDRNQVYRSLFFQFIDQKMKGPAPKAKAKEKDKKDEAKPEEKKEPESPTYRLVSLLGMIGSRNLILAFRVFKAREGRYPQAEDGSLNLKPSELLKTAIECEDIFQRNNLEYSETAYAAGYLFDYFLSLRAKDPNFKKLEPYYKEIVKRAQRTGLIAYLLAEAIPGTSPKHAAAAGMLSQLGKLMMASSYDDGKSPYAGAEREYEKAMDLTATAAAILERHEFRISHEEVGAQILRYTQLFHDLVPVVRFYREPYCLKGVDAQNYKFALLLCLADRMAGVWRTPNDDKDKVFAAWQHPAVKALKLKNDQMIMVMRKAMAMR